MLLQQQQHNKLARLQEALDGIEQWAESVVAGLYPLQWQLAQDPRTRHTDYNRSYHTNMVNPTSQIARILETYNGSTRRHLQLLRQTLESSSEIVPNGSYSSGGSDRLVGTESTLPPPPPPQTGYHTYPTMRSMRRNTTVEPVQSHNQRQLAYAPKSNLGREEFSSLSSTAVMDFRVERSHGAGLVKMPPEELSSDDDLQHNDEPAVVGKEVEYLLAKQFKSVKTGERLGFPVYSADKELLGFYQEFGNFTPTPSDFGPTEKLQAVRILETAPSAAVYAKQGRSMATLLNHALVYEWSQGLSYSEESGQSSRGRNTTSTM